MRRGCGVLHVFHVEFGVLGGGGWCCCKFVMCHTFHVTPHTSHLGHHVSHVTCHTLHFMCHTSTRRTSQVGEWSGSKGLPVQRQEMHTQPDPTAVHLKSHVTHHTSHITRHTSHVTGLHRVRDQRGRYPEDSHEFFPGAGVRVCVCDCV